MGQIAADGCLMAYHKFSNDYIRVETVETCTAWNCGVGAWWYISQNLVKCDQEYFDHRLATYGVSPDLIPKNARIQITVIIRDHVQYRRKQGVYEGKTRMGGERYDYWFLDETLKLAAYILLPNHAKDIISIDKSKWSSLQTTASLLPPILDNNEVPYVF